MRKKVENHYLIDIDIKKNLLDIELDKIFKLASRNNSKRMFLFVSTLLGKHLSLYPDISILTAKLLAFLYSKSDFNDIEGIKLDIKNIINSLKYESADYAENSLIDKKQNLKSKYLNKKMILNEKTVFISFAETATSLGHIVFDSFENAYAFYHTTRENIKSDSKLEFFEEHSHASNHKLYNNNKINIKNAEKIVLIDDEISTGKTILNIIKELKSKYNVEKYAVLTIMDFRNKENRERFIKFALENDVKIDVYSLISGEIREVEKLDYDFSAIENHDLYTREIMEDFDINVVEFLDREAKYLKYTGRFGLSNDESIEIEKFIEKNIFKILKFKSGKTLVLGTEEFMYIPLRISEKLGDVEFKSTTRSPIFPYYSSNYPIKTGEKFKSYYNEDIDNYIYNLSEENYDTIIVMVEKFKENLKLFSLNYALKKHAKNVVFVLI